VKNWDWRLALLLVPAILVRIIYANDVYVGIQGDAVQYLAAAQRFFDGGLLGPNADRPPFYPFLLAVAAKLTNLQVGSFWLYTVLNIVLDCTSLFLLARMGKRVVGELWIFGVMWVSLSPLLFGHVNSPVTETITVTLFLAFMEFWTREKREQKDEIWAGVFLGLMTLTRGMFYLFPLFIILFEQIPFLSPKEMTIRGKRLVIFLASAFALPVLWGVRNKFVLGDFIMTQSDQTAVLMAWLAVKLPLLDWHLEEHQKWVTSHPWADVLMGRADPVRTKEIFDLMRAEVIDLIKVHPFEYLSIIPPKMWRLWVGGWWNPFSYAYSPPYLRTVYQFGFCIPILFFGLVGLISQWASRSKAVWRATRVQLLLAIYITGITFPFTVDARYSLPAYVPFAIWVGLGLKWFVMGKS
jgi:hypothetical protein